MVRARDKLVSFHSGVINPAPAQDITSIIIVVITHVIIASAIRDNSTFSVTLLKHESEEIYELVIILMVFKKSLKSFNLSGETEASISQ